MPTHRDYGPYRMQYERAKARILREQEVCALCGKLVDKSLKFPNPYSGTVDHIIPVARGGHPTDPTNLQLAHLCCNRKKGDRLPGDEQARFVEEKEIGNRVLPLCEDWSNFRLKEN